MGVWDAIVAVARFGGKLLGFIREKDAKKSEQEKLDAVTGEAAGRSAYDESKHAGHPNTWDDITKPTGIKN